MQQCTLPEGSSLQSHSEHGDGSYIPAISLARVVLPCGPLVPDRSLNKTICKTGQFLSPEALPCILSALSLSPLLHVPEIFCCPSTPPISTTSVSSYCPSVFYKLEPISTTPPLVSQPKGKKLKHLEHINNTNNNNNKIPPPSSTQTAHHDFSTTQRPRLHAPLPRSQALPASLQDHERARRQDLDPRDFPAAWVRSPRKGHDH